LRQNILANKQHFPENEIDEEQMDRPAYEQVALAREEEDSTLYSQRSQYLRTRNNLIPRPNVPQTEEPEQGYEDDDEQWNDEYDYDDADPDLDYDEEDPLDARVAQQPYMVRRSLRATGTRAQQMPPTEEEYGYEDEYSNEAEEEYAPEEPRRVAPRRKQKKRKVSRRGLLMGAGAALVGATAVTAVELGPKLPQAMGEVGNNIEKQLQDAFNKGVSQGAAQARKEILTALDDLEGFTLNGAIAAAQLTRVAYDVFVSPLIKFGANISADFLNNMLRAFKTARGWLAGAFQDNATLQAIQHVMESWATQVSSMPKQLDAVTNTDLDGAQAYLRALQRMITEEKAKLNNPSQATPTAQTTPTANNKNNKNAK
jgi:hypothetical protein